MNFDNLVEDAEKHGASVSDSFSLHMVGKVGILFYEDELKALITQYVNQALAQGQEPVAKFARHGASITSFEYLSGADHLPIGEHLLFTRAQPTPAQIAGIQAQALEYAADEILKMIDYDGAAAYLQDTAKELRKGEPL